MSKIIFVILIFCLFPFPLTSLCIAQRQISYAEENNTIIMVGEYNGISVRFPSFSYNRLQIVNNGDYPVEFNYFEDKCYYITNDGKTFVLQFDKGDRPYYPETKPLNPEENTTMMLSGEFDAFTHKLEEGKVKEMLLIINYGKTKIRLIPLKNRAVKEERR